MRLFQSAATAPVAIATLLACAAIVGCAQDEEEAQPSGLLVLTDNLTGCQYVARLGTFLTPASVVPRQRANGHQVCEAAEAKP